jgi:hypothetical protein
VACSKDEMSVCSHLNDVEFHKCDKYLSGVGVYQRLSPNCTSSISSLAARGSGGTTVYWIEHAQSYLATVPHSDLDIKTSLKS